MLYLITGANGAGKTLNALKWVRERSISESRPVCHNGRFKPVEGGELSTWKHVDIKNWQDEPDGTIFLVDECHNDFPVRPPSGTPPDYVRMLAEHRRRGMDFYLITQHPQNIDSFVRRLIGSPGWHRHLRKLCITQHHLCFPYPFFHLVNFPSLRAQVFAHRQAFEALFSACTQFLGALMPSSPTALAATNAAPSTNCPAQTRCAAAACSSSDPGNAL